MVRTNRAWVGLVAMAALLGACMGGSDAGSGNNPSTGTPGTTSPSATSTAGDITSAIDGVATASDAANAAETSGMMSGGATMTPIPDGMEMFRCDLHPMIKVMTVCGHMFPSSIDLSWMNCNAIGPREIFHAQAGDKGMTTSGTVSITNTVTLDPEGQCTRTTKVSIERTVQSMITTTGADGSREVDADVTVKSDRDPTAMTFTNSESHDITITQKDASGMMTSTRHLVGMLTSTFAVANGMATRTLNGMISDTKDGKTASLTITDLVRPSFRVCRFPTSGTIERDAADGTKHTLVFGPNCGDITLDGTKVTLPMDQVRMGDNDADDSKSN